jgi:hypothetical protein
MKVLNVVSAVSPAAWVWPFNVFASIPPFELPEVTAVVRATHLSCQNAGKAQKFTPVRGSSGEISD